MSEQRMPDDVVGSTDHPQHRAPEGEGYDAPRNDQGGGTGVAQHSIFDGAGNEIVVATTTNAEGQRQQGTGDTAAEAIEDAQDPSKPIGEGFSPGGGH
jgi:hypothetical protein